MTKLQNGGLLLEMDSDRAANWIQQAPQQQTFTVVFNAEATIKSRTFTAVAQFVPLTFDPNSEEELREVEKVSGLDANTIIKARYAKLVHRRAVGQVTAWVIITLNSPKQANHAIFNGLTICQKRVTVEKCKREPLRCLKCHRWNHIVSECINQFDICSTCGSEHRTSECDTIDRKHCQSYNTNDHTSWDQNCPTFEKKQTEMDERM